MTANAACIAALAAQPKLALPRLFLRLCPTAPMLHLQLCTWSAITSRDSERQSGLLLVSPCLLQLYAASSKLDRMLVCRLPSPTDSAAMRTAWRPPGTLSVLCCTERFVCDQSSKMNWVLHQFAYPIGGWDE